MSTIEKNIVMEELKTLTVKPSVRRTRSKTVYIEAQKAIERERSITLMDSNSKGSTNMRIKKVGRSTSPPKASGAQLLMNKKDEKVVLEKPTKDLEIDTINQSEGRKHRSLSSVSTFKNHDEKHDVTAQLCDPDIVKPKNVVILNKLYNEIKSSANNNSQTIIRNVRVAPPTNGNSKNLNIISTKISKAGNVDNNTKDLNIKNKEQSKAITNIEDRSSTYTITRNGEIQESPGESISYDELSYDELTYDELSSSSEECTESLNYNISPDLISVIDSDDADDGFLEAAKVEKSGNKKKEYDGKNLNKTNKSLRALAQTNDKISPLTPTAITEMNNTIKRAKELTKTNNSIIKVHQANNVLAKEEKEEAVRNGSKAGKCLNIVPVTEASEGTYSVMKAPEIINGKIASEIDILAKSKQIRRASVTAKTNIKEFTKSLRQNSRRDNSPPKEETNVNQIKSLKRRVPADFKADYVINKLSKSLPCKSTSDDNVDGAKSLNVSNLFKKSNNKEEITINSEKCASPLGLESPENYKTNENTLKVDAMFRSSIPDKNESDDEMKLVMDISSNSFEDNLELEAADTTKVNGLTNLHTNGTKNIKIVDKAINLDKNNHSTDYNGNKKIESNKYNTSVQNFENSNLIKVNIPQMKKQNLSNSISQYEKNKPLVSVLSKENQLKKKESISVQLGKNMENKGATVVKRRQTICMNRIPEPKIVVKDKPNSISSNKNEVIEKKSSAKRRMTICMNSIPKKESTPSADIVVQPEIKPKPNPIRTRRRTFVELSSVKEDGKIIPGSRKTVRVNPVYFDKIKNQFSSSKSKKSSTLTYSNVKVPTPTTESAQQPPIPKMTIKKRESIYYSNFVEEVEDKSNSAVNMNPSKPSSNSQSTADNRNKIIMNNNNESSLKIVNVFSNFNSAGGDSAKNRRKESHVPKIVDDVEFECVDLTAGDPEMSDDIPKHQNKSVSNNVQIKSGIRVDAEVSDDIPKHHNKSVSNNVQIKPGIRVRRESLLIKKKIDDVTVIANDTSKIPSGSSLLINRRKSILKPKHADILFESNTEEYHPTNEHLMKCVSFARAALAFALEQRGLPTNLYRHAHSFDLLIKKYKFANEMAKGK